jgi:hypothetical protein
LVGLLFPQERILFCCIPFAAYCFFYFFLFFNFCTKGQFSFLSVSVDHTSLFFSISALCSETFVIFSEPSPKNLTSFQSFLEIAGSGLCYPLKLPV